MSLDAPTTAAPPRRRPASDSARQTADTSTQLGALALRSSCASSAGGGPVERLLDPACRRQLWRDLMLHGRRRVQNPLP